ncbi:MAG: EcsC family protein [Deltaproteobacteria bacterium]|nr:EcsC family protein [Deltaproteobacteria bacterium]
MDISKKDLDDLKYAKSLLEHPGLAAKITSHLGAPIEKGFDFLPKGWHNIVSSSSRKALEVAANSAILTMKKSAKPNAANTFHKIMAAGSGAAGGFLGLPALPLELPVSTTIMLRSIADIARSENQLISDPKIKMACIEVFALGGPGKNDDAAETGYFAIRAGLAKSVTDAAKYIAEKGLSQKSSPALIKLISQISSRFGIQVSEKMAAQAIPVIGAVGGAIINTLFIDHFQAMARGHFIILRLEKKYTFNAIKQAYESL